MLDFIGWVISNIALGIVNLVTVLVSPSAWPDFSDKEWVVRMVYYGASVEFFFVIFDLCVILLLVGLFWRRSVLWGFVRGSEAVNNGIGRLASWAVLLMVLQQVIIVVLQRIFRVPDITVSPFGYGFTRDVSWFAEELKLYNAMLVTLCAAYTFIQGGHVRVDLVYSAVSFRTRKIIDMAGSLFFAVPFLTVVWLYAWYFMWRHMLRPPVASSYDLDRLLRSAKIMKWDVETIGFSPNGFDAYILFKVLLVAFAGLMFLQAVTYFYRSLLEFIEGEAAENRYLDTDAQREAAAIADTPGHGA